MIRHGSLLALLLAASIGFSQPPAPVAAPAKTIDQLLEELAQAKKLKAEAEKQEKATVDAIKAYLKTLDVKLKKAGIDVGPAPAPKPKPKPPVPDPEPPIAGDGLRVLIVYETGDLANPATDAILRGAQVRGYLIANCVKGPNGVTPEYRMFDKDVDTTNLPKHWKDAMARPRRSVPWILVSNGRTGYEGPLPNSVDETIALIDKYRK